jgi:hydrogenase nickel incorporation protein HypA/HybF
MHELSVTESILEIALRHARDADAKQIVQINLVVGQLASIVDDSVQFYWEIIAKDSIAEHARLNFRRIPAEFECRSCGHRFNMDGDDLFCSHCGSVEIKITAGDEFFIEAIDIET